MQMVFALEVRGDAWLEAGGRIEVPRTAADDRHVVDAVREGTAEHLTAAWADPTDGDEAA